jgi:hypothetical protein
VTLQQLSSGYLALAGGTMTGPMTLSGNASAALQPVAYQQLTAAPGGYLPLAGGTLTLRTLSVGSSGLFQLYDNGTYRLVITTITWQRTGSAGFDSPTGRASGSAGRRRQRTLRRGRLG